MNYKLAISFLVLGLLMSGVMYFSQISPSCNSFDSLSTMEQRSVIHHHVEIKTQIARTEKEHTQGLSGICDIPENHGMLFVFENEGIYPFWMKDMMIPIDLVWIDASFRIIDIIQHWSPETYPETEQTTIPIQYVLELPAGFIERNMMMPGDILILQ